MKPSINMGFAPTFALTCPPPSLLLKRLKRAWLGPVGANTPALGPFPSAVFDGPTYYSLPADRAPDDLPSFPATFDRAIDTQAQQGQQQQLQPIELRELAPLEHRAHRPAVGTAIQRLLP